MKSSKQTLAAVLLCATPFLTLVGCSQHPNPLTKVSQHDAGVFLANASYYAEKSLKWSEPFGAGGAYGYCMGAAKKPAHCSALYQAMLTYAKQSKEFQSLSLAELTNQNVYEKLKDSYQGAAFDL